MTTQKRAIDLEPGDIVIDSPSVEVSHTIIYPPLTPGTERHVDVFYTGRSYPVYVAASTVFDVIGHADRAGI